MLFKYFEIGPVEKFLQGISLPKGWKNDEKKKIKAQKIVTGFQQTLYCAGLCAFSTIFGPYPFLELINSLTGWNMKIDECFETGFRIQTLRQAFTLREGIDIVNNKLNDRVVGNPPFDKRQVFWHNAHRFTKRYIGNTVFRRINDRFGDLFSPAACPVCC